MRIQPLAGSALQEGLARLRTFVRPDCPDAYDAEWHSSIWRWLESHPAANKLHRWVLVTEDQEVVGHLAALPQYYRINGQRVIAHTPADYQVHPQYGFYALSLMRMFFRTCQNCVACDAIPEVISIESRMGAEEVGKLRLAVKVRNVSGLLHFPAAIPRPVPRLLSWALRTVDRALTSIHPKDDLEVRSLDGFDESFDTLFERIASTVPCIPERDSSFLRWRYGPDSPQTSAAILGVRDEGQLLGYAVLWVSRDRNGYLLDLTTLPGRYDVSRALLWEAVRYSRRIDVRSIRYRFLESSTSPRLYDLQRLGFFLPNTKRHTLLRRHTLLTKFKDNDLHRSASNVAHWSYSAGDGEASFWAKR